MPRIYVISYIRPSPNTHTPASRPKLPHHTYIAYQSLVMWSYSVLSELRHSLTPGGLTPVKTRDPHREAMIGGRDVV